MKGNPSSFIFADGCVSAFPWLVEYSFQVRIAARKHTPDIFNRLILFFNLALPNTYPTRTQRIELN